MSEQPRAGDSGAAPPSAGIKKSLIIALVVVVVSAGAGVAVYFFVIAPRLQETAEGAEHAGAEDSDLIPETAVAVDLEEAQASVIDPEAGGKNAVLIYQVSIICNNLETKQLIEKNKQWFVSMLMELHSNRNKKDIQDTEFQKNLLRQAVEEGNSLLRRLQKEPNPEIRIFQMLHLKCTVFTMP